MAAPRLIATIGLHGSASTCVFNIVRELMIAVAGANNVLALYAEDLGAFPVPLSREHRHVVLKSHSGSPAWEWLMWLSDAPIILTVRDPRDAILSMVERFGTQPQHALNAIQADCDRAVRCADAGATLLRYEERFFADETLATRLAAQLGLGVGEEACRSIGARYSTEGVKSIAVGLGGLEPGRVVQGGSMQFDSVTQIHRSHIGDGMIGKWRARIPPDQGEMLTRLFAPFLERFGYAA